MRYKHVDIDIDLPGDMVLFSTDVVIDEYICETISVTCDIDCWWLDVEFEIGRCGWDTDNLCRFLLENQEELSSIVDKLVVKEML